MVHFHPSEAEVVALAGDAEAGASLAGRPGLVATHFSATARPAAGEAFRSPSLAARTRGHRGRDAAKLPVGGMGVERG